MKPIVFVDNSKNYYLYSVYKNQIINIDRKLYDLITEYLNNPRMFVSNYFFKDRDEELNYVFKRFNYLKKNGFFKIDNPYTVNGRLFVEDIEMALSNLKVITFELTQKCNLKCTYCVYREMYDSSAPNESVDLSFDIAKAVIDFFYKQFNSNAAASINRSVSIGFYGGEPLLRFDLLKQILCYSKDLNTQNFSFHYNITTNGLLLDKYMDFLVENNVTLLVSLDGDLSTSKYRLTRNNSDSFPVVFRNLVQLKDNYPEYFKKNVSFNAVFHNRSDILKILTFFKINFDTIPIFSELTSVSLKKEYEEVYKSMFQSVNRAVQLNKDLISPVIHHKINPILPQTFKFVEGCGGSHYRGYRHLLTRNMKMNHIPTASCTPFANKLFVSADGKFHPCEKVGHDYPLGYIDENFNVKIDYKSILDRYNGYYDRIAQKCIKCYRVNSCTTCLFQRDLDCQPINREEMTQYLKNSINSIRRNKSILNLHKNSIQ